MAAGGCACPYTVDKQRGNVLPGNTACEPVRRPVTAFNPGWYLYMAKPLEAIYQLLPL